MKKAKAQDQIRNSNTNTKASFNHLHPSIIANPTIRKEKEKSKLLRNKEILENNKLGTDEGNNNKETNSNTNIVIDNDTFIGMEEPLPNNKRTTKIPAERHIKLTTNSEKFDIKNELNTTLCNITLGQLLDLSPKIRSELSKLLKIEKNNIISATNNLNPSITIVNNIAHDYDSKAKEVTEDELAMVRAKVEDKVARLLVDTCNNINVITREFLEKLKNYKKIGFCKNRIRQATVDCEPQEDLMVQVPLFVGDLAMNLEFRVINNPDTFYDILIGLKAQADNKLVVLPHKKALVQLKDDGSFIHLSTLNKNIPDEKLICLVKMNDHLSANDNTNSTVCAINSFKTSVQVSSNWSDGLTPIQFINHPEFLHQLDQDFRESLVETLRDNIDAICYLFRPINTFTLRDSSY